jgi:hypothetical protein
MRRDALLQHRKDHMAFDTSRLRFGDLVAGGSALVLFISLFLDWYNVDLGVISPGLSAFDALGIGPILMLLIALAVIAIVVVRATGTTLELPLPLSTVMLGLGALATLYIVFRILVVPADGLGRSFGIFLAFLAAIGIVVGSFLSARERGEAVPGVDGGLGGFGGASGGGGGPLGGGQPAATPAATTAGVGAASAGAADPGAAAAGGPKADWYPDPQGQARLRYWDGSQWTDQTAD